MPSASAPSKVDRRPGVIAAITGALAAARPWAMRLLGTGLLAAAAFVLWREFRALDLAHVGHLMRSWGGLRILAALACVAASFMLVGLVEWLALRWSGAPLPLPTALTRSFMVNGLIHSLGSNVVTATLTRTWVYRRMKLQLLPSAALTAFSAVSFVGGLAAMSSLGLLAATPAQLGVSGWTPPAARATALVLAAGVVTYLALCAALPGRRLAGKIGMPPLHYALAQVAIGAVDNTASAALLWMLLGPGAAPFGTFVFAYALSGLAGVLSAVPGGLGVFEGALVVLAPHIGPERLAAAFLGFRIFSYLLPLVLALALTGVEAVRRPRETA